MPIPIEELQKQNPSAIIELFTLTMDSAIHGSTVSPVYRFHNGSNHSNGEVIWAGQNYQRFPIEATGFEFKGQKQGVLPRPSLRISNFAFFFTDLMLLVNKTTFGNDLRKCKLTRIRTLAKYLDNGNFSNNTNPYGSPDSTQELPQEVYFINRKVIETREMVEFECVSPFDLANVRLPKRQYTHQEFKALGNYI